MMMMSREEIHENTLKYKPIYTNICPKNMPNFDRVFCQKDLLVCALTAEVVLVTILFFQTYFKHLVLKYFLQKT